jgi:hypothetical protein
MSTPSSAVDICNLALDRVGQLPISSILNPQTVSEDICARHYDATRRKKLRQYIFNFSKRDTTLIKASNAPVHPQFATAYTIPNDLLRLHTLGDWRLYGGNVPTQFFDIANGFIYCDDITDQGVQINSTAQLSIIAIYRSGDVVSGVTVPVGMTVIAVTAGTPIGGAEYLISGVLGTIQLNGNTYQINAGLLSGISVYFLQTASGVNFDSSTYGAYTGGGAATPTYISPGANMVPTNLEICYTSDFTLVPKFDPLFVDVLVLELAKKISPKFTLKPSTIDQIENELKDANLAAAAVAGQEKPPRRVQRSRIRDVRRSGGIFRNNTMIGDGLGNW